MGLNIPKFDSVERKVIEGKALHDYRRGKIATFVAEIYRDWIIPDLAKEIQSGAKFIATLTLEEMQYVADSLVTCESNNLIKEKILNGELISPEEVEGYKEIVRGDFMKRGDKHFMEILKAEMKGVELDVFVNIAGKQKDMIGYVDKMTNMLRFIFSTFNPQTGTFAALDDPRIVKPMNEILERSGLSQIDFTAKPKVATPMPNAQPSPIQPQNLPTPVAPQQNAY